MARVAMKSKTAKRAFFLLCAFALFAGYLCYVLFHMQVTQYDEYQQKVIDQVTVETSVDASRGSIFDRNMNILATNSTTWRVFISPVDIQSAVYSSEIERAIYRVRYGESMEAAKVGVAQDELIADGLSRILGVDYNTILEKTAKKNRLDETIKKDVDKETADKVLAFIDEYSLSSQIHLSATTKRYYCYDNLASNTIGFTGSDGQGLYGIEYKYDDKLAGTSGKFITARDANGNEMPYNYESYIEAENGYNLVSTIDMRIQYELELQLEEALANSAAQNRVCGVVMDVNTGAILAMATKPDFNLNSPYDLDELSLAKLEQSGFAEGSDEYAKLKSELRAKMWNNKPLTELYEPGSTFKIITTAMALEEGVVTPTETFTCGGSLTVSGVRISCHKVAGHGTVTFTRGLQQSCNPVLMTIAARVGSEKFYNYFKSFGYLEKTNIDLPGEASSVFHSLPNFKTIELATASFGQRFKVSTINHLTAICAVANGGYLVTPHLLDSFVDDDGNIIYKYDEEIKRQVISNSTARTITEILEAGVSGDGGAKNAYVKGYKVAAKTGTSEKFDVLDENGNSYLRIGSCVAYAPADNPQVAVIIVVDEPTSGSVYGSVVAAPYVSKVMGAILPYLGIEPSYSAEELASLEVSVTKYVDMSVADAKAAIAKLGIKVEVIGDGDTVTAQMPKSGNTVAKESGKIILYTNGTEPSQTITVPNLIGKTAAEANDLLLGMGLNVSIEGAQNYEKGSGATVTSQNPAAGEKVSRGSVVTVEVLHIETSD